MIRALIFDFDGLILDTEVPDFESWQEIFAEYDCSLSLDTWSGYIGTASDAFSPFDHLEAQLGTPILRDEIRDRRRARYLELVARQSILPGVREYLNDARRLGLKIGLATSSSGGWAPGHLDRLELLRYFDSVHCAEHVKVVKPDPELYLRCVAALGVEPHETVALEDSPNGIRAARRAGLYCVAVPNALTRGLPLHEADLQLTSLSEMPLEALLRKLSGSGPPAGGTRADVPSPAGAVE